MNGQLMTDARICDMYSRRMRKLYTETCNTGNLADFLAFALRRRQVFIQTIPVCERLLMQQTFAAMQAQNLGIMCSAYKNMGGMINATQGHSYTVGNSFAGYGYANEMPLQGAVMISNRGIWLSGYRLR
ncbi:Fc.00g114780.m01.CDS01 [Cosmosporella sp. VM-42]